MDHTALVYLIDKQGDFRCAVQPQAEARGSRRRSATLYVGVDFCGSSPRLSRPATRRLGSTSVGANVSGRSRPCSVLFQRKGASVSSIAAHHAAPDSNSQCRGVHARMRSFPARHGRTIRARRGLLTARSRLRPIWPHSPPSIEPSTPKPGLSNRVQRPRSGVAMRQKHSRRPQEKRPQNRAAQVRAQALRLAHVDEEVCIQPLSQRERWPQRRTVCGCLFPGRGLDPPTC